MYFDLSHFALLEISGKDAHAFLQGQFTCDLGDLEKYGWLFSSWCLPNGKVICTFIIFIRDDIHYLILPAMLRDKIIQRIKMYILRSDVKINDVSDNYAILGLSGITIDKILHPITSANIQVKGQLRTSKDFSFLEFPGKPPRYILISKIESISKILDNITATSISGDRDTWSLLDIENGLPWIVNSTSENFLPQMLNIDHLHGLSFNKGCFPGQEIISRLHYRGQLKKKLFLGSGQADFTPGPGDRVVIKNNGQPVGEIIDAERNNIGGFSFLAVTEIESAGNDALALQEMTDVAVKLKPITYSY